MRVLINDICACCTFFQAVLEFSGLQPSPTSPTIQQGFLSYQGDACFYLWSQFYPVKTGPDRKPGWRVGLVRQGWCSCNVDADTRWQRGTWHGNNDVYLELTLHEIRICLFFARGNILQVDLFKLEPKSLWSNHLLNRSPWTKHVPLLFRAFSVSCVSLQARRHTGARLLCCPLLVSVKLTNLCPCCVPARPGCCWSPTIFDMLILNFGYRGAQKRVCH